MPGVRWTRDDDAELGQRFATEAAAQIADSTGRSEIAIYIRARHLGLRKGRRHFEAALPDDLTIAYTAGIIDGEGSIQINPSSAGQKGKRWWRMSVAIQMVAGVELRELRAQWSDIGHFTKWQPKRGRRPVFMWAVDGGPEAEWFLRALLPQLRIKREHAQLALEFREQVGPVGSRVTVESSAHRTEIALKMRVLNERSGKAKARLIHAAV